MTKEELKEKVRQLGQFPANRRRRNYQSYWLDGEYVKGSRDTLKRFDAMGIPKDLSGKTIVDLGCQIGAICTECYLRGARVITGIDMNMDYIQIAHNIAMYNNHKIYYSVKDLANLLWGTNIFTYKFDILFLLSMYKHIKDSNFRSLLIFLKWKEAYIESNNCSNGYESKQALDIEMAIRNNCKKYIRLGILEDRGRRCLWKLENV